MHKMLEAVALADVYENSTRWQHCGVGSLVSRKEDDWFLSIPLGDEKNTLVVSCSEVAGFVYCPVEDLCGFVLDVRDRTHGFSSLGINLIFLKMVTDEEESGTGCQELGFLVKFITKYGKKTKIDDLNSLKGIRKFLETLGLLNIYTAMFPSKGTMTRINKDNMGVLNGWKCCLSEDEESVACVHRQFRPYFRLFIYFVLDNQVGRKKSKKTLRNMDNIVKFVKKYSWDHEVHLLKTLGNFFLRHYCHSAKCDGFSFLQCSACMSAHYCSERCQLEDLPRHQHECKFLEFIGEQNYFLARKLTAYLETILGHSDFISLKTFIRVLNYRVYECFYGALSVDNSRTAEWMVSNMLSGLPAAKSKEKLLTMLKENRKSRTKTLKEIRTQVERVYGEDNLLSRIWLRDPNRDPKLLVRMFQDLINAPDSDSL